MTVTVADWLLANATIFHVRPDWHHSVAAIATKRLRDAGLELTDQNIRAEIEALRTEWVKAFFSEEELAVYTHIPEIKALRIDEAKQNAKRRGELIENRIFMKLNKVQRQHRAARKMAGDDDGFIP